MCKVIDSRLQKSTRDNGYQKYNIFKAPKPKSHIIGEEALLIISSKVLQSLQSLVLTGLRSWSILVL